MLNFQINTEQSPPSKGVQSPRSRAVSGCCSLKKHFFLLHISYMFCAPMKKSILPCVPTLLVISRKMEIDRDGDRAVWRNCFGCFPKDSCG